MSAGQILLGKGLLALGLDIMAAALIVARTQLRYDWARTGLAVCAGLLFLCALGIWLAPVAHEHPADEETSIFRPGERSDE